jgi:ribose transport system permease protein
VAACGHGRTRKVESRSREGGQTWRRTLPADEAKTGLPAATDVPEPTGAPDGDGTATPGRRRALLTVDTETARAFIGRYAVVLALLAFIVFFSVLRPDTFFTIDNFESILITESVLVVMALGLVLPLGTGEFDLSVAAVLGFSAGLLAHLTSANDWSVVAALVVTFMCALGVGVVNGLFVVGLGVNSFITTLGVATIVSGLAIAIFGAETIGGIPSSFSDPFREEIFGIDTPVYLAFALALVLWYFLEHTPTGRYVFFTGEGREAARLAGVRVNRIRFGALVASALFAWLAGIVLAAQTGAAQATYGNPFLLPAFAAAFLGATTIKVGRPNAWGTVVAVYLLAVGTTGLQLLGAADWVEDVFNGSALVLAVALARLTARER